MVKKFLLMKMISIHAPTRGATCNSIRPLCIYEFQSTLPREERHKCRRNSNITTRFQSTLPREERPIIGGIKSMRKFISIHAPTRGATHRSAQLQQAHSISIHAPTRGATNDLLFYLNEFCISIHAPTRGATTGYNCISYGKLISIHAPTRGATIVC